MRAQHVLGLMVALTPLGAGSARAAGYSVAPIVKFGDTVGTRLIQTGLDGTFEIGALNDNGQISLVTENAAGGELLIQYSNGTLTPIVVGGGAVPGGQWLTDVGILSPVAMNQHGNMAFAADVQSGAFDGLGTYLWNATSSQFTAVAVHGMPQEFELTFARGGNWLTDINNSDEVAFTATVGTATGEQLGGDFFLGQDHVLKAIARPGDVLGDGTVILDACNPSLNDAGVVAFSARRVQDSTNTHHPNSAFLWQGGIVRNLAPVGALLPDGKQISNVVGSWVNNHNSNVLLAVNTTPPGDAPTTTEAPVSLYLWSNGTFTPVAIPGQTMPDGSKLVTIQDFGVSYANDLGQHAFIGVLDDGNPAAYLMNADGTLSLILKSGTTTNLGLILNLGEGAGTSSGIALNSKGQVVLTAFIDLGVDTVYLLTPTGP
jgi:hypothetical protein